MKQLLINPFTRIAGGKALAWGFVFITAEAAMQRVLSNLINLRPAVALTKDTMSAFTATLADDIVSLLIMALMLYVAGLLISKSKAGIRPIDVLGTAGFSKVALLPMYIFMIMPPFCSVLQGIKRSGPEGLTPFTILAIVLLGLVIVTAGIWYIVFLYRAFCTSCNVRGTKAVLAFVAALVATLGISGLLPEFRW